MGEKLYKDIGQKFTELFETSMGQMFGKPCLKTNKKAFAAFFKGEMVFKIGAEEVNILKAKYEGSTNWDPSGKNRPMKDWLQVPMDYSESWEQLAKEAYDYTRSNK